MKAAKKLMGGGFEIDLICFEGMKFGILLMLLLRLYLLLNASSYKNDSVRLLLFVLFQ